MPCIINAESGTGLTNSADGSGIIKIQSNSVTTNALAWVNFNGTGTVAIRSSYNVSSITDNGIGNYTVNFATALSDANYSTVVTPSAINGTEGGAAGGCNSPSQSQVTVLIHVVSATSTPTQDRSIVNVAIFGN